MKQTETNSDITWFGCHKHRYMGMRVCPKCKAEKKSKVRVLIDNAKERLENNER